MRRKVAVYLIVLITIISFTSALNAQNASDPAIKFMFEPGFGKSYFLVGQNLSPWGVHFRGNYNSGFFINMHGSFIFKDRSILGLKCDMIGTAANYVIEEGQRVSDNVSIIYFAPQIGAISAHSTRFSFSLQTGVGYAYYQSIGLLEYEEYNINSHMLGLNIDLSFDYIISNKGSIGCKFSVFTALSNELQREIGGVKDNIKMDKTNQIFPATNSVSIFLRRYF